ncbi:hypothetical protein KCP69_10225 [Salmonella enterica subsp. enterica]|nr:hypothetical protein KCP69_10225 [Salmonella enterica subsp. enterica]
MNLKMRFLLVLFCLFSLAGCQPSNADDYAADALLPNRKVKREARNKDRQYYPVLGQRKVAVDNTATKPPQTFGNFGL